MADTVSPSFYPGARVYPDGDAVISSARQSGDTSDRWQVRADGSTRIGAGGAAPVYSLAPDMGLVTGTLISEALGIWVVNPVMLGTTTTFATQVLSLQFFRAPLTMTITSLRTVITAYTATGHTYAGVGLYREEANGDVTLLAKVEDTGSPPTFLGSAANFTNAFNQSTLLTRGQRYAVGDLSVFTGGAMSLVAGNWLGANSTAKTDLNSSTGAGTRISAAVTAQTTLPASLTNATIGAATAANLGRYIKLVP